MVAPDVQIEDGKGTILISSEEGETEGTTLALFTCNPCGGRSWALLIACVSVVFAVCGRPAGSEAFWCWVPRGLVSDTMHRFWQLTRGNTFCSFPRALLPMSWA